MPVHIEEITAEDKIDGSEVVVDRAPSENLDSVPMAPMDVEEDSDVTIAWVTDSQFQTQAVRRVTSRAVHISQHAFVIDGVNDDTGAAFRRAVTLSLRATR